MRSFDEAISRIDSEIWQRKDRQLDDEIESHVQMHIEDNLSIGPDA
jgi:hypothetical protein